VVAFTVFHDFRGFDEIHYRLQQTTISLESALPRVPARSGNVERLLSAGCVEELVK
jgi:hypothetical protein